VPGIADLYPAKAVRIGFYGLLGSKSWWYDSTSRTVLDIPRYFSLDAIAGYTIKERYEIFLRLGNVFNEYFYSDPGFPWRGRYFEIGLKADVLK